jgi:hypothetical protein
MGRAPQTVRNPAQPEEQQAIGFPPHFRLFLLEEFKGLNTRAKRPAIDDQEMAWCENWMPIGPANLLTMYGQGDPIYTAVALTIVWHFQYNIGATVYSAVFLSDGSATQVRLSDGATTTIGPATTFYNGGDLPHAVQWANNGILIVSTAQANGYWAWDGTTLFSPNDFAPSWLSGNPAPIVLTGDTNTSTSITTVSPDPIASGVLINMGISSSANDIPVGTLITAGTTNTLTISNAATASNMAVTLTVDWVMPTGVQGTAIETFQGRVWIINGITRMTSAPLNGTTFAAANGGVIANSTDNTLRVRYTAIKESNGYLYLFGDSSCYYVTNLQTSGTTTATTTYQYTPLDEQIGTPWRDTVQPFGRSVIFTNPNGIYAITGSSATKISDPLDGLFIHADFNALTPCASSFTLFNIKLFCLLFRAMNPYSGLTYNMMAVFDGRRFWTATQDVAPTFVSVQETDSTLATYGTDGASIYKLFAQPSDTLVKTLISKLWGGQYGFVSYKNALRLYSEVGSDTGEIGVLQVTLDNENGPIGNPVVMTNTADINFVNNSGGLLTFVNNTAGVLQFVIAAIIGRRNVNGSGLLLGFTLTSVNEDIVLERMGLGYVDQTALY